MVNIVTSSRVSGPGHPSTGHRRPDPLMGCLRVVCELVIVRNPGLDDDILVIMEIKFIVLLVTLIEQGMFRRYLLDRVPHTVEDENGPSLRKQPESLSDRYVGSLAFSTSFL